MAENLPNLPVGAVPPKPEAKVQPKKETVRINLPPKPTAVPTVKLPSPAGPPQPGPAPLPAPPAAAPVPVASGAPVAHAAAVPAAAPQRATAAPAAPRPLPMMAPASAPALPLVDKVLSLLAALIGVGVLVRLLFLGN